MLSIIIYSFYAENKNVAAAVKLYKYETLSDEIIAIRNQLN